MTREERNILEEIRDDIEGLIDQADDDSTGDDIVMHEYNEFHMSFGAVKTIIDAGLIDIFNVGDRIWNENKAADSPICWKVIGKNADEPNTLTIWAIRGFGDRPFDKKSKEYPYGHNLWRDSSIREWLNTDVLNGFSEKDIAAIRPVEKNTYTCDKDGGEAITTTDHLWLLSASEVGLKDTDYFRDEGKPYEAFDGTDESRQIGDWFRLRSASRSYACSVWYVTSSGIATYGYYATGADRPAPACVIG